jgi:hypothetical protein
MFIHHPLISFFRRRRPFTENEGERTMTWLTSLSFRGHWSRPTDGSRQKRKRTPIDCQKKVTH